MGEDQAREEDTVNAYLLSSGDILHPRRVDAPGGIIVDGWGLATPGSSDFEAWKPFTQPTNTRAETTAARLRMPHQGQPGR